MEKQYELLLGIGIDLALLGIMLAILGQETVGLVLMYLAFIVTSIIAFSPLLMAILKEWRELRGGQDDKIKH